jgi:hypothetical protein
MTRHRIAQSGENGNPKSPENRPEPAVSCKNDYSDPAARPPCSTAWRFFTGDYFGPFKSEAEAKRFIAGEQKRFPLPVAAIRNNP